MTMNRLTRVVILLDPQETFEVKQRAGKVPLSRYGRDAMLEGWKRDKDSPSDDLPRPRNVPVSRRGASARERAARSIESSGPSGLPKPEVLDVAADVAKLKRKANGWHLVDGIMVCRHGLRHCTVCG
jgi:hypothetical protein